MKAIVLSGGFATRLRPISYVLPKLLFPVLGKPMIFRTLDILKGLGIEKVVLAVNYLADSLRSTVGSKYEGIEIDYSLEKSPLGTGGPIRLASEMTRFDETFIAMNGDVIANIDLAAMLKHHDQTKSLLTDALHEVRDPTRFGVVQIDGDKRIRRFIEKPKKGRAPSHLVNAGIYIIEPEVLKMIPANRKVSLEREIFPVLAADGKLWGFPFSGDWFDIGSFSDYRKANFTMLVAQARQKSSKDSPYSRIATIRPPVLLGAGSEVEKQARVGPRVVAGMNDLIESRARVSDSILFDRVRIGEDSIVSGAIVASDATVGNRVKIGPGSVVSPFAQIRDGVRIGNNAIIHPYKDVEENVKAESHVM